MLQDCRKIDSMFSSCPIVALLTAKCPSAAVSIASALAHGGITVIEVVLRTPAALQCIIALKSIDREIIVGAGTVLNTTQLSSVIDAGADFVVTPGITKELLMFAEKIAVPLLPGIATPSEIMSLMGYGYHRLKFFPAEAAGGERFLKSMQDPFPGVKFYPTGGINCWNAPRYVSLANVMCVGGSWIVPQDAIDEKNWPKIERLARAAISLCSSSRISD